MRLLKLSEPSFRPIALLSRACLYSRRHRSSSRRPRHEAASRQHDGHRQRHSGRLPNDGQRFQRGRQRRSFFRIPGLAGPAPSIHFGAFRIACARAASQRATDSGVPWISDQSGSRREARPGRVLLVRRSAASATEPRADGRTAGELSPAQRARRIPRALRAGSIP